MVDLWFFDCPFVSVSRDGKAIKFTNSKRLKSETTIACKSKTENLSVDTTC